MIHEKDERQMRDMRKTNTKTYNKERTNDDIEASV